MEIWKNIDGFKGYMVSNCGNVRSPRKTLSQHKNGKGYYRVYLPDGKFHFVHRLVAQAFVDNPNGYPIINHKDENRTNNHADNLEWCTHKYNSNYGSAPYKSGQKLQKHVIQILPNGEIVRWESLRAIERELGFAHNNISKACKGYFKKAYGYEWRFGV